MQKTATPIITPKLNNEPRQGAGITLSSAFIKCVIVVSYLCQMLVLYNRSTFENIIGPIFALCSAILVFTDYYYIPVSIVILTPYAIGTVFMGNVSFYVFMGFMLVGKLFIIKFNTTFTLTDICWLVLGLFNIMHLAVIKPDYMSSGKLIMMAIFLSWMIFMRMDKRRDPKIFEKFLLTYAFAVTSNAFVSIVTRGATKYIASDRLGIIGIGANDPNIAAMMLTIAIAVIISTQYLNVWLKSGLILVPIISLITTVSISGFLAVVVLLLSFGIIMNKNRHNMSVFMFIILGALVAIYIFPSLGIMGEENLLGETTNYLEYYQEKINSKLGAFVSDDIDTATSGRTAIMRTNMSFLMEQSPIRQLFGGNKVNPLGLGVSHNTFADMALRFGFIGLVCVIIMVIYSFVKNVSRLREDKNCTLLLCKIMLLYWSVTLSIFDGSVAILWMAIVLLF